MKIFIISDAWKPQINGVVRTYEYLSEELFKLGHDVKIAGPADFPLRMPMPGYSEIELVLKPYRRLAAMFAEYDPDTIHIATEGPLGKAALRYCRKNGRPFTTTYHTHFPDYIAKRIGKFLPFLAHPAKKLAIKSLRKFHGHARAMYIATQSLEDELKSWGFTTPVYRLTRGVPVDLFRPDGRKVMDDMPRPIALYVGRVAIEKNIGDFLDMAWDGSKVIIGDGPSLHDLKAKYPEAHFIGKKEGEELAAYYRSSDLFVFPSRTDTFGIVLIEALASGIPVAGYNVTGPQDIITQPYLGALHEHDLAHAAREALKLAVHKEKRVQYARNHYTWPAVAQQFLDAIPDSEKNA